MDAKTPTQQLLALLQGNYGAENTKDVDPKKLKYVLYARKSTTDDERQERSIPDQIQDCLKSCVTPKGLNVVKIVEEKYSAKEPDTRTEFSRMINDIKAGRYDGIIAWHPDRLSRNMKEAGEIIDLLDKGILKDLQFATLTFENNPTGKMLLGISFVLSKQYSEHLSESVARGNKHITEKGEYIGQLKHGYMITKDRKLYPDGQNFTIIKQAFEKRMAGERQLDIAKWLNKTGYMVRRWQKDPEPFVWDKDAVHKLLKDPVYAGVLKYGKNLVDLMPLYDFQQAISVEDFLKINKTSSLSSTKLVSSMVVKSKEATRANYLRGIVYCGHCHKAFSSGITTKKKKDEDGKEYHEERYYYRCETLTCPFRNKSVPSTQVTWHAYNYLKDHRFTTRENYDYWTSKAKEQLKQTLKQMESRITSLSKTIALKEDEYEETKKLIRVNPVLQEHYDLKAIKKEIKTYKDEQSKLVTDRKEAKSALPTYEKYLELINGVSEILMDEEEGWVKDSVVRVFFSNFTVTADNFTMKRGYDITHKLNEPWEGFVKSEKFDRGRLVHDQKSIRSLIG